MPEDPFGEPTAEVILAFFFWVSAVPLALMGVFGAFRLARAVPDLFARREVVGEVVRAERALAVVPGDGYTMYGFAYLLHVRDQHSGRVESFHVGSELLRSAGASIVYSLQPGDWVRLVVAPRLRWVHLVEAVRDGHGKPLPPLGRTPETPEGAPVDTVSFMRVVRAPIPRISINDTRSHGTTVRVWTYEFDDAAQVVVYLARGEHAEDDVRALAAPGEQTSELLTPPPKPKKRGRLAALLAGPPKQSKLGAHAYRLPRPELLVVPGLTVVAIQQAGTWPGEERHWARGTPYPPAGWDEDRAHLALGRMRRGDTGLPAATVGD